VVCIAKSHKIGEEVAFIYNIIRFFRDNEARRGNMEIYMDTYLITQCGLQMFSISNYAC